MPQYIFVPLVALIGCGLLALVLVWAHSPGERVPDPRRTRHGILVEVATRRDRAGADDVAHRLRIAGVRATVSEHRGTYSVLVWPDQRAVAELRVREMH